MLDLPTAKELLENILSCFSVKERWIIHKDNDGKWIDVSEDLHDYLTEAREHLKPED